MTWRLWIDTGGTFTDCVARSPEGELRRCKVLSSSALRGELLEGMPEETVVDGDADRVRIHGVPDLPRGFCHGARVHALDEEKGLAPGAPVELRFDEEAPILAARLVTGSARAADLPEMELRLGTTRGTNALLERRGAATAFFVTRGFGDLLRIGDQRRPDLFALAIDKPEPLYAEVVEVDERLDAAGDVLRSLRTEEEGDGSPVEIARRLRREGMESAAVAFLHSYVNPRHEEELRDLLRREGFGFVSCSAELTPTIKILPRAATAVVDAYLSPVVARYLERVGEALPEKARRRLRVMTSAGGLVGADRYRAKDSLLSGPAGGVVGAARIAGELGFRRMIAFDMGGTSTDVSRFDGELPYRYRQRVGDAEVAAPALAIETVAAGGGSICRFDGRRLRVGPESAGASPGPACYGAGGPLTLTDVNLLLGRLDPQRFGIPVDVSAAEAAADSLHEMVAREGGEGSDLGREALLAGCLEIADQRMAGAVRRISVRQGYDPRGYALVAFGGAGGQHACAVAEELGVETLILPREAGLLSALGMGAARIERFATGQILRPLHEIDDLGERLGRLEAEAREAVRDEGLEDDEVEVRRRLAFLRFLGQDATLDIELEGDAEPGTRRLAGAFLRRYEERFGYRPEDGTIEVESLRVVASSREEAVDADRLELHEDLGDDAPQADVVGERCAFFGRWRKVPVYEVAAWTPGRVVEGPALVFDPHASLSLAPGWRAGRSEKGSVLARRNSR